MEPVSAVKIQLESAQLCLDLTCNAVFDGAGSRCCPACGGDAIYPLVVWLNRAQGLTLGGRVGARDWREPSAVVAATRIRAA